jgi:MFS family permease
MGEPKALGRLHIPDLTSQHRQSGRQDPPSDPNSATPLRPQDDFSPYSRISAGPLSDNYNFESIRGSAEDKRRSMPGFRETTVFNNLDPHQDVVRSLPSHRSMSSSRKSQPISLNSSIQPYGPKDIIIGCKAVDNDVEYEAQRPNVETPHHVFDKRRKKRLVWLISLAAMFSPLSSNIYFPALPEISEVCITRNLVKEDDTKYSKSLKTPSTLIALTVSTYMIFQGLAPSLWGPLADTYGRRPILLSTLVIYIIANLILAFTINFPMLLVFRGIQALGSASTIAIGAGVIGDIAVASERGGLMGLFGGIRMFGQAVGPVFGGALAHTLGFRSIFWFLFGLAIIVTLLLGLLIPETLRMIAGDGSKPLYGVYKPWISMIGKKKKSLPQGERPKLEKLSLGIFLDLLRPLGEKDVFVALLFGSIIYTIWSMITASTSTLFKHEYKLNQVLIGLCFLPNGMHSQMIFTNSY